MKLKANEGRIDRLVGHATSLLTLCEQYRRGRALDEELLDELNLEGDSIFEICNQQLERED